MCTNPSPFPTRPGRQPRNGSGKGSARCRPSIGRCRDVLEVEPGTASNRRSSRVGPVSRPSFQLDRWIVPLGPIEAVHLGSKVTAQATRSRRWCGGLRRHTRAICLACGERACADARSMPPAETLGWPALAACRRRWPVNSPSSSHLSQARTSIPQGVHNEMDDLREARNMPGSGGYTVQHPSALWSGAAGRKWCRCRRQQHWHRSFNPASRRWPLRGGGCDCRMS